MKAIVNRIEGAPAEDLYPVPRFDDTPMALDFLASEDLGEVETGIQGLGKSSDIISILLGVAVLRVEREGLWMQADYKSLKEYRAVQAKRLGMPAPSISYCRKVADAWLQYRKILGPLDLAGHVAKLEFFDRAMKLHDSRKLVLEHFKKDTWREFRAFAVPAEEADPLPDVALSISRAGISLDGEELVAFSEDLPEDERGFIGGVLRAAYRARRGECLAHVVAVYDEGEARAVDLFLKKLRAKK